MTRPGRPGRPRDPRVDGLIIHAAVALLQEDGYDRLTIERVAARAGVGRQTIYRRWASKGLLVGDAVLAGAVSVSDLVIPDTGDLFRDLRDALSAWAQPWTTSEGAALVRALAAAAADDEATAVELYQRLSGPSHDAIVARCERAAENGDLRPDADPRAAADALLGGLLFLVMAQAEPLDIRRAQALLAALLHGLLAAGTDETHEAEAESP